jgi:hypothetical protein
MFTFLVFHFFAALLCFYRENFEVKLGELGRIMRFTEVIGVLGYVALISNAFTNYGIYRMFDKVVIGKAIKKELFNGRDIPDCIKDNTVNSDVVYNSIYWLEIEIMVAMTYLFTMMILMLKSRFTLIGIDQSG